MLHAGQKYPRYLHVDTKVDTEYTPYHLRAKPDPRLSFTGLSHVRSHPQQLQASKFSESMVGLRFSPPFDHSTRVHSSFFCLLTRPASSHFRYTMRYRRMPIEIEAPEELGCDIRFNLSENAIGDRTLEDLCVAIPNLSLKYTEHCGSSRLRSLVAQMYAALDIDDVLITPGASSALFLIATSLLTCDDHLVVTRPNYATNVETPRAIGCEISFVELEIERAFQIDIEEVAAAIRPNTRLISVTSPNNPTGTVIAKNMMVALARLAEERGCYLLVDETYAGITYEQDRPSIASLGNHIISVSSLSKSFGVPGLRMGWLITKNKTLQETFLAAKEQISICGSTIDEWIAEQILSKGPEILTKTKQEMQARLDRVSACILTEEQYLEWVRPAGSVVCFIHIKKEPVGGISAFYERLLKTYGTYVGPGRWFERPDTFFRLGYGYPTIPELETGLDRISRALRQ